MANSLRFRQVPPGTKRALIGAKLSVAHPAPGGAPEALDCAASGSEIPG
jgi:hypothetical protein